MDDQPDPLTDIDDICFEVAAWCDATQSVKRDDIDGVFLNELLNEAYEKLEAASNVINGS